VPSLALCKEDVCCGCHQYDSRSFTAGFLIFEESTRGTHFVGLCVLHADNAV